MNLFPSGLYQPTQKDLTNFAPRPFYFRSFNSAAAAALTRQFRGSDVGAGTDMIMVIQWIQAVATGGGGQTVTDLLVNLTDGTAAPNFLGLISESTSYGFHTGAATFMKGEWRGELVMPGDTTEFVQGSKQLLMTALYSAGVAPNTVAFSVGGFYFPRGNWQLP